MEHHEARSIAAFSVAVSRSGSPWATTPPRLPAESLVALLLKPWFEPSIVHSFHRRDFDPAPQVEAVLLRLINSQNGPDVKLTSTEDGAGLALGGDSGYVQILSRGANPPFIKIVNKDGREQTIKP